MVDVVSLDMLREMLGCTAGQGPGIFRMQAWPSVLTASMLLSVEETLLLSLATT